MINDQTAREPLPFGKPSKSFDIKGFLQRYGLLVLVIGSFLFTLTVPILLILGKPDYEVKALIRIDPVIPSLITNSEDPSIINYYQDYARTQAKRMMEFEVLKKTVEKLSPEQKAAVLPRDLPADKCAMILERIIDVSPVNGTHLLEITASSPKKEGLAPLVNNFMEVFLNKVRSKTVLQDKERLAFLNQKQQVLTNEIKAIENNLDALTKSIYTGSFSEEYNIASKKTEELQQLYVQNFGERVIAENEYKATEITSREIQKLSLEPMVEELVMGDQSLDFTSSWTYQQLQQLRSSTDGLTPNNPDRIYVEQRMKGMQLYEKKLENDVRKRARTILSGKRDFELDNKRIVAKNNLEKAKKAEEEISEALKKNLEESVRISLGMHLGQSLDYRLKHNLELLSRIDTRINEIEVEGKAPLRISIESMAREPDGAAGSNIKKLLVVFLGLSFGGTGALFFAYDFFDNRIRRPEDIKNAFGYPPAAIIPKAHQGSQFHKLLNLEHDKLAGKALRSFAITLGREKEEHGASVMLFTAVDRQAGCSSIALHTAQALSAIVPKVLFIDADTENPALGDLPGVDPGAPGFCDILASDMPWRTAVTKASGFLPDIISAGTPPKGHLPQQRIQALLKDAAKEYDIVCIDTAPILESDLTEHLATNANITGLIALGDSTFYRDLRAAAERLVRLEIPAIAPILNWGGKTRALSIDKLLERQPEFLRKVDTQHLEQFLHKLPPATEVFGKARELFDKNAAIIQERLKKRAVKKKQRKS